MSEFDMILDRICKNRLAERERFYNSIDEKLFEILVDFKCYMYSKGKFENLTSEDFNEYKSVNNIKLDFYINMKIYEEWFGYKFNYDDKKQKWTTIKKGDKVLNFLKE